MSDQVLEQVKRIVAEDLDVNLAYEEIDDTVPLFEEGLALDSVILVELISFIEKRFNIELRDDVLNMETFHNLQSVARVIREHLAEQRV
ncbi:MAG TPA: phosphopantetheine-binding protein [Thermoanaerobaculia bacterium]|nr:phosphopantetheine-binding protein [Thermoanaerobaculia bacterium]